jgi:hypothetical protein
MASSEKRSARINRALQRLSAYKPLGPAKTVQTQKPDGRYPHRFIRVAPGQSLPNMGQYRSPRRRLGKT